MKQPKINESTCIGCGTCAGLCGATFAVTGPTASVVNPSGNTEEELSTAVASCPTQSISLEDLAN